MPIKMSPRLCEKYGFIRCIERMGKSVFGGGKWLTMPAGRCKGFFGYTLAYMGNMDKVN